MKRMIAGVALAVVALFMLSGYLTADMARSSPDAIAAAVLVIGLPAFGSVMLLGSHFRQGRHLRSRKDHLRQQTVESEILKLAGSKGGRLTAVEVATHMALSPEGATEALDRLALRGQADYQVTDAGVIVYSFYDIVNQDGKDSAKGVLDA